MNPEHERSGHKESNQGVNVGPIFNHTAPSVLLSSRKLAQHCHRGEEEDRREGERRRGEEGRKRETVEMDYLKTHSLSQLMAGQQVAQV